MAARNITPGEAAEIGKVIDTYVKAYQTAELNDRVARVEQLTDAELLRVIARAQVNEAHTTLPMVVVGAAELACASGKRKVIGTLPPT